MRIGAIEFLMVVATCAPPLLLHLILKQEPSAETRRRYRPLLGFYAVPVCFAIAAFLTPPDAFTLLLAGIPLSFLLTAFVAAILWFSGKG